MRQVDFYIFIVDDLHSIKNLASVSEFCVTAAIFSDVSFRTADEATSSPLPALMCLDVFRDLVHRTAHQPGRCDWCDSHGSSFWIRRCQLPLHLHVLLPQVMRTWSLFSPFTAFLLFSSILMDIDLGIFLNKSYYLHCLLLFVLHVFILMAISI